MIGKLRKLTLVFMFLILSLGTTYTITYQNVSAVADEIISDIVEINYYTPNGPTLDKDDNFGASVTNIGDLNNDGVTDIAVGATGDGDGGGGGTSRGVVHVIFMNSNGTVSDTMEIHEEIANGPNLANFDNFGASIANIGDLNNDGVPDIVVGAWGDDGGGDDRGAVHIIFMNSNGTISRTIDINDTTLNGPVLNNTDYFGVSIANIGDLNGDGTTDIAVGASGDDARGAVHILFLNSNGTISNTIEINSNTPNGPVLNNTDYFGVSIANIGDLNNDGTTDIAVGAIYDDAGGDDRGTIHILFLNSNGTVSNTIEINDDTPNGPALNNNDDFGRSIANIGDLNGDGISDIAVGATYDNARGAIHILLLNSNGTVSNTIEINDTTLNGPALNNDDRFGTSIANIGDLNGDGVLDIAVGATHDDDVVGAIDDVGAIHIMFMDNTAFLQAFITNITSDGVTGTLKVGDTITFTLTTNSTDSGATINGAYNSVPLLWSSTDNGITYTAIYTVSEGETDQSTPLQITDVTITNSTDYTSQSFDGTDVLVTIDANSPKFVSAEVVSNSQIMITVDQNVTVSAVNLDDFTLGGITGSSIASITAISNNITITLATGTISEVGSVTVSYTKTSSSFDDTSGNSLLDFAENVTNTRDLPPIITLTGANPQTIVLGDGYKELGATADDGSQITINSDEFRDILGTYSIYYDSTDTIGNNATQVIRTVIVSATVPPIIILIGDNPQTILLGAGYTELGAITSDGSLVTVNSIEFVDAVGTYSIYYDSTNTAGTSAVQVVRTVHVVGGPPPIITLTGANPQTIILGDGYTELGATTNDDSPVTVNSDEFIDVVGTYSIYYDSTNTSGTSALQVVRTVHVINTPPPDCEPPTSGDWVITTSCMINSSVTIQGSVIVRDGSVLIIPSRVVLDIDFVSFSLTVQSGSGVLIKSGGTVT